MHYQAVVLECAKDEGIEVRWQNMGYFDLYTADEVFVTGTAAEVEAAIEAIMKEAAR
jgi:branched-chain amino acid aminotransferase